MEINLSGFQNTSIIRKLCIDLVKIQQKREYWRIKLEQMNGKLTFTGKGQYKPGLFRNQMHKSNLLFKIMQFISVNNIVIFILAVYL